MGTPAIQAARNHIKNVYPGAESFDSENAILGDNGKDYSKWAVTSLVSGKNAFGGPVRSGFLTTVECRVSGCTVIDCNQIGEQ
jgi:hypothetical protein